MLVITEHRPGTARSFLDDARALLDVLARADGFIAGDIGRSPDDPTVFLLATRWRDVGSMRRALGGFEAKVAAAPVMVTAVDRVSTFEVLVEVGATGAVALFGDSLP